MHSITDHPTAIEDIVSTFQSQQMPNVNQETQSWILMEILGAIPEEVTVFLKYKMTYSNCNFHCAHSCAFCFRVRPTSCTLQYKECLFRMKYAHGRHLSSAPCNSLFYQNWIRRQMTMTWPRFYERSSVRKLG